MNHTRSWREARKSVCDVALGKRGPQLLQARACHVRVNKAQNLEVLEGSESLYPCVRNLRLGDVQRLEVGERSQFLHPHIRQLGVAEVQTLELRERTQLLQPRVG